MWRKHDQGVKYCLYCTALSPVLSTAFSRKGQSLSAVKLIWNLYLRYVMMSNGKFYVIHFAEISKQMKLSHHFGRVHTQDFTYCFVASWGGHCHFCKDSAQEVSEGSESRWPRMVEDEWGWGGNGRWGWRPEKTNQRKISWDHFTLSEEKKTEGCGWKSEEP